MSSTNRGAARQRLDAYYTPDDVAARCVSVLDVDPTTVLEPHVGGGAFARAVRLRWPGAKLIGVDADPSAAGLDVCDERHVSDFLAWQPAVKPSLIVGNPPYADAEAHVRAALAMVAFGGRVAFLLRLAFLEGKKRSAFWDQNPPSALHVLSARPSFTGGGTDSCAYALFVWGGDTGGRCALGWT
jgi:hypothetical protein